MESTYTKTLRELLLKVPGKVKLPPYLESDGSAAGELCLPNERRRFPRRKILADVLCQVIAGLPTVPRTSEIIKVFALDISRSGIRFATHEQLYPEEGVLLWTLIGRIPCRVARCMRHNDHCYEVGAEIRK